jgi:hypothetical protein
LREFNDFLTTELKPKCGNCIGTYSLVFFGSRMANGKYGIKRAVFFTGKQKYIRDIYNFTFTYG